MSSEDWPGVQKIRSKLSIASSEPTPTNRFSGFRTGLSKGLRRLQISFLSWV